MLCIFGNHAPEARDFNTESWNELDLLKSPGMCTCFRGKERAFAIMTKTCIIPQVFFDYINVILRAFRAQKLPKHRPWTSLANAYGRIKGHKICWTQIHTDKRSDGHRPWTQPANTSIRMAGKRGTTFVEHSFTALTIHTDKQSHEYIVHGPNRHCRIKRHNICWTLLHSNNDPHW